MSDIKINENMDAMVKSLIDVQQSQGEKIENLTESIDTIRVAIMTNLRFELHDTMMECIQRGYTTPDEYDKITEKMHVYLLLKGNHGIEALYEEKYNKLPIHQ